MARKVCNWRLKYFYENAEGAVIRQETGHKLSPVYDLTWHDLCVTPDFISKLNPWQKVNMYAGI